MRITRCSLALLFVGGMVSGYSSMLPLWAKHEVNIHVVLTRPEQEVFDTIMMKESVATAMAEQLIQHVRGQ